MGSPCGECGREAARLRRGRCDACYMRLYRNGEVADGARCVACGERRKQVLAAARLDVTVVLCGNCSLVLNRTRPRIATVDELRRSVVRERRGQGDRREVWRGGRRSTDKPRSGSPAFDPAVD